MAHHMEFRAVENGMVVFVCKDCRRPVGFHHPDTGHPRAAVATKDGFDMPEKANEEGFEIIQTLGKCDT